jgi:hypothetical protein
LRGASGLAEGIVTAGAFDAVAGGSVGGAESVSPGGFASVSGATVIGRVASSGAGAGAGADACTFFGPHPCKNKIPASSAPAPAAAASLRFFLIAAVAAIRFCLVAIRFWRAAISITVFPSRTAG